MKNKLQLLFLFFILIFSSANRICSQTNSNSEWQLIGLTLGGNNILDGVEAFFQLGTCSGEDVIYIKFINHTAAPVKLEWYDAVFTQEQKWIKKEQEADKKSLKIAANKEDKGACSVSSSDSYSSELIVKLKDFVSDKKNFKRYSASNLTVTAVQ